ncbi:Forkhead box protein J1-B [Fasciola hepatica]|uniref:Forkhead box protein J1-B n=1 Tax=Fasciola hepatica TaxID=6192 RepID=A0A4E0RM67_FASHE|nr:Forkhead box protein J1-B [Fasciola hepatica]
MGSRVHDWPSDLCINGMNMLSERLRRNWMQKLDSCNMPDDSLTSLSWLYDMHPIGIEMETNLKFTEIDMVPEPNNSACLIKFSSYGPHRFAGSLFDPKVRLEYRTKWTGKPPFSYATLICLAMRELGKPKVTLSDIYGWIMNNFAYYRHTDSSWQNSVRHNLSLNKCFEKVPRDKNERGKGGFWRVNPKHADWLEANLAKCRKAAPPPGPPPPIPRSMLLQQRHQQTQETGLLVSSATQISTSLGVLQGISHDMISTVANPRFEQSKWTTVTALSPSSTSSISSLSSSPQSMSSVPSPAGILNGRLQPSLGSFPHFLPVSTGHVTNVCAPPEIDIHDATRTTLPLVQQNHFLSHNSASHASVRRRKSPLNACKPCDSALSSLIDDVDDDRFCTPDIEYHTTDCTKHKNSSHNHKDNTEAKTRRNQGLGMGGSVHRSHVVGLQKSQKEPIGSKLEGIVRATGVSSSNGSTTDTLALRGAGRPDQRLKQQHQQLVKDHLKLSAKRSVPSTRARNESKLIPTRVLPPRHRYSRWSRPRDNPVDTIVSSLVPQHSMENRRSVSEYEENTKELKRKMRSNRHLTLPCLDENGDDSDNTWPPCGSVSKAKSPRDCSCHTTYTVEQQHSTLPKLSEAVESNSLTPPYVPAGLAPGRSGYAGSIPRESSSSAASSCSLGSAFSNRSSAHGSDGHLYHSVSVISQRNLSCVETQTSQLFDLPSKSNNMVQFSRLYPTSDEAEAHLGASPDRLRMPKWAAVFLPEGEESELEPLYGTHAQSNDRETMHFFSNLDPAEEQLMGFSNSVRRLNSLSAPRDLSVTNGDLNVHHRELNGMDHSATSTITTSVLDCASPSGCGVSATVDGTNNLSETESRSQARFLAASSPLLEEFDLDANCLDFEALSSLVEASGPIPLDLDLALTASFGGHCAGYSNDSALGTSDHGHIDLNHTAKNSGISPWPGASATGADGLDHSWFVDSMGYSGSCCLSTILDETDTQPTRHTEANRLNTPPS